MREPAPRQPAPDAVAIMAEAEFRSAIAALETFYGHGGSEPDAEEVLLLDVDLARARFLKTRPKKA